MEGGALCATYEEKREKALRAHAIEVREALEKGKHEQEIVAELMALGIERTTAEQLVARAGKELRRDNIPLPLLASAHQLALFVCFGVAGMLATIGATFLLGFATSFLIRFHGFKESLAGTMAPGLQMAGGLMGLLPCCPDGHDGRRSRQCRRDAVGNLPDRQRLPVVASTQEQKDLRAARWHALHASCAELSWKFDSNPSHTGMKSL